MALANNKKYNRQKARENKHTDIDTQAHRTVIKADPNQLHAMIENIDGAKWGVNYYQQVLGKNDVANSLDIDLNKTEQSYNLIKKVELSVESGIEATTGTAIVKSFTPNKWDLFKTTTIDSDTLFVVTDVEQLRYNLKNVYRITYKIDTTYTSDKYRYESVDTKILRKYVYSNDALYTTSARVLLEDDMDRYNKYMKLIKEMSDIYVNKFRNDDYILCVKTSQGIIHDSYTNYLFRLLSKASLDFYSLDQDINGTIVDTLLGNKIIKGFKHIYIHRTRDYDKHIINIPPSITHITSTIKGTPLIINVKSELLPTKVYGDEEYIRGGSSVFSTILKDVIDDKGIIDHIELDKLIDGLSSYTDEEWYFYAPYIMFFIKYYITNSHSVDIGGRHG